MRYAALALLTLAPFAKADQVDDLLAKMHAAYQLVHSADIKIQTRFMNGDKHITEICHIQFVAPNLLYETATQKESTPGMPKLGGFTYISDGKRLQTIGRSMPGSANGIKPYSPSAAQDDGVPVYKEALCLWDWKRQWSGEKGGKASGFRYQIKPAVKWEGKQYIGLTELAPDRRQAFHYFIDPKTYLIKASVFFIPNEQATDWQPVEECDVTNLKINPKIDRSVFKINA